MIDILHVLAEAAALSPAAGTGSVEQLLPVAHALTEELYPDLLRPEINRIPSWIPWLWPAPVKRCGSVAAVPDWCAARSGICLGLVPLVALAFPIVMLWDAIEPFLQILS